VLYVEDNAVAQVLMRRHLRDVCDLTVMPTLAKARAIVAERRFDLVISDFLFPDGDAVEFIVGLRRTASAAELPVLLVSGSLDMLVISRALKSGANEALAKPLKPDVVQACVQRLLADPTVREPDPHMCGVYCFQWLADGVAYEYCPELQLTVSGPTKAEASKRMQDELHARVLAGTRLGFTAVEKIVTHIVRT